MDSSGSYRRRFVKGLVGSSIAMSHGISRSLLASSKDQGMELNGNDLDLFIHERPVNFTGKQRVATMVNNSLPGPTLRFKEGQQVKIRVHNQLKTNTSIHWHGILLPSNMDGVPGLSFEGIKPGQTFQYEFDLKQNGTYWYHSHSGFQEQTGLYGALIIDPLEPIHGYDNEYTILLSDWSDENPSTIYKKLKKSSEYYNFNKRTVADLMAEINAQGLASTAKDREMWNKMRMSDRDILDLSAFTYTYLLNGRPPADPWSIQFSPKEKILLRIINGSAMSFFDFRIPGLKMKVVAADGQNIEPISVDEIRIGTAETYDVIVEPESDSAYSIFSQAMDRSGYALGVLTSNPQHQVQVPKMDAVPSLSHMDMGMHDIMDSEHAGMEHSGHGGMHMAIQTRERKKTSHMESEYGPHVDMRVDYPRDALSDPGVGLRNTGRTALRYADIRSLTKRSVEAEPEREVELHLTGNMHRYMWSFNGQKYADAQPVNLKYGERIRIILVNDTMMNHPIHLHGLWSELETGDMDYLPNKHTVIVQPGSKISYQVHANAKGRWAYHCHLMYHMMGMFREVRVT